MQNSWNSNTGLINNSKLSFIWQLFSLEFVIWSLEFTRDDVLSRLDQHIGICTKSFRHNVEYKALVGGVTQCMTIACMTVDITNVLALFPCYWKQIGNHEPHHHTDVMCANHLQPSTTIYNHLLSVAEYSLDISALSPQINCKGQSAFCETRTPVKIIINQKGGWSGLVLTPLWAVFRLCEACQCSCGGENSQSVADVHQFGEIHGR